MIAEIRYKGHTAVPSDYNCTDGELSLALNMIPEDGGELKAIMPPRMLFTLNAKETVLLTHKVGGKTNYVILENNSKLYFKRTESGVKTFICDLDYSTEWSGVVIGKTIVVTDSSEMKYLLWDATTERYNDLGNSLPELGLSFSLSAKYDSLLSYFNDKMSDNDKFEQIMGQVNKFVQEKAVEKDKFIFPFLLRYAYRLFDGTLSKHSPPILMLASTGNSPYVGYMESYNYINVYAAVHDIVMENALDDSIRKELLNWKDIISSVDIFVSAPIYTYDQSKNVISYTAKIPESSSVCSADYKEAVFNGVAEIPLETLRKVENIIYDRDTIKYDKYAELPYYDKEKLEKDICSTANFYHIASLDLESVVNYNGKLSLEEGVLKSLVAREVMTDDWDSHDLLMPSYLYVYNSRLNAANMRKQLFGGFPAGVSFERTDALPWMDAENPPVSDSKYVTAYVTINRNGKDIVVKSIDLGQFLTTVGDVSLMHYFYYPDGNATEVLFVCEGKRGEKTIYKIQLKRHDFLNGAYYFSWHPLSNVVTEEPIESTVSDKIVDFPNKLYTSEIGNPFAFPVTGINTIGAGEVIGMSAAAKALSQGQFGQFPLYVFATDGVWALEVSSTGGYSAKQPITRDVCINSKSITSIDSSVLFATKRGIMLLSGSQAQCITDSVNAQEIFSIKELPMYEALIDLLKNENDMFINIASSDIVMKPFSDFLANCRMIYDYINQRIIIYNDYLQESYVYVYSLKSFAWGMMFCDIVSKVDSYPEALAICNTGMENVLVDFSQISEKVSSGMLVTRPFKFGEADVFKTIKTIIQRGFFKDGRLKQVLYGSNDLHNWHIVWSSNSRYMRGFRGTPYKSFRLAVICSLAENERLSGCSIEYENRMTNQLR